MNGARRGGCFTTIGLFGATAIVAQVLLLRESLVVVAGNELFIALFFGCWFVGIAAGAAVGAGWKVRESRLFLLVPLFLSLQVVLLPLLMISLRDVRARWGIPAWQLMSFFQLLRMAAEHLCPFSFLTGLTFPILCRMIAGASSGRGGAIGIVYGVESLGSLIGGAAVTFVFAAYCQPLTGAWVLGALTAANLAVFLWKGHRTALDWSDPSDASDLSDAEQPQDFPAKPTIPRFHWAAAAFFLLALGYLVVLITPLRTRVEQWSAGLRHRAFGAEFQWLAERTTPYQHLALARQGEQFSLLSNGQFIESFPDPYAIPQRVHLMMSQCDERPRRVLLIGGGATGVLRSLLLYRGLEIDYVEIDPQVLEIVRPYLEEADRAAMSDPRVHVFHEDARSFVRRRIEQRGTGGGPLYDAILCNTPDPSTAALNRFYTLDFFAQCRRLLGDKGIFVSSISSGVNYFNEEMLGYVGSVFEALNEAFGHVLATPGTRAVLFATARGDWLTSDSARLSERFERRGISDGNFSPLFFQSAYETNQLELVNRSLRRTLGSVRPNSDLEPATYLHYLHLWNYFAGGRSQRFFSLIERYNWRWVVAACVVLLLIRVALRRRWPMTSDRAAWRHAAMVLLLTGMAGMVSSILLLLLFQNVHGSLYRDVGLLVALFMGGLTVGSFAGNRIGREEKKGLIGRLAVVALAYALFLAALEGLAMSGSTGWLAGAMLSHSGFFYVAMVVAGILTGAPFPLIGRLAVVCGRDPGRAGGVLESLDHLGACVGAFLTGVVLVPVSGIGGTLAVLVALQILAAVSLGLIARATDRKE